METEGLEQALLVDGAIVLETDDHLSMEHRASLMRSAQAVWPGRTIAILDRGMKVARNHEPQLTRIEQKLDMLLGALAEEADQEEPGMDLEGRPLPRERVEGEPL